MHAVGKVEGAGEIRTREVLVENGPEVLRLTVDGDALALDGVQIVARSTANATCIAEAFHFEDRKTVQASKDIVWTRVITHWRKREGDQILADQFADLRQIVGESTTLTFTLPNGGVLYSFGFA